MAKKMSKVTRKATEKSLKKWQDIVAGTDVDRGWENCALCQRFSSWHCTTKTSVSIRGYAYGELCPIAAVTGKSSCRGSPYEKWAAHHKKAHGNVTYKEGLKVRCRWCAYYAWKMVDFIQKILDEDDKLAEDPARVKHAKSKKPNSKRK